jgi:BspA type Leucine rich repeat region (6 copies)
MKNLTPLLLAIMLLGKNVWADFYSAPFFYTTNASGVSITGYNGNGGTIQIPNAISNSPVVTIADGAFSGLTSLTNISIPNSVRSIENNAFAGCKSLRSITIPTNVTSIGDNVFSGCSSLPSTNGFGYVTWSKGVIITKYSGPGGSVSIPSAIKGLPVITIESAAFADLNSLTAITVPSTVVSIGEGAFSSCTNLKSINLPKNLITISEYAFYQCTSLTNITIPKSVTYIGDGAFQGCTALPSANGFQSVAWTKGLIITGYTGSGGDISIPSVINGVPVTSIGANSFSRDNLTSVKIPDGVSFIGGAAFSGSHNLTNVTIPQSVTNINSYGFAWCSSLKNVWIPNRKATVGSFAFEGCPSLPSSNGLQYVQLGNDIMITGLKERITIPRAIEGKPVTAIADGAFNGGYPKPKEIILPDTVTGVPPNAFGYLVSLTNVTIPSSVTNIGVGAFQDCSSISSLTIPNGVVTIEAGAFQNCSNLLNIRIPDSVTSIESIAFLGCNTNLKVYASPQKIRNLLIPNAVDLGLNPSQIVQP